MNFIKVILFVICIALSAFGDGEFYSENTYSDRDKNFVSTFQAKYFLNSSNEYFYLGLVYSGDVKSKPQRIYNDNYWGPLFGVRYSLLPFLKVFGEARYVKSVFKKELEYSEQDFRFGFTGFHQQALKNFDENAKLISDTYGELIYSSRILNDIFFNLKSSIGYEYLGSVARPQVYIEGFVKRDRLGFYFENVNEARLGLKVSETIEKWNFILSTYHVIGMYTDREYKDRNPYSKKYQANTILFVAAGEF